MHTTPASRDTWCLHWRYFKQGIFTEVTTCAEAEKMGEGEVRKKSNAVVSRALSEDLQRLWLCFQVTVFLSVLSSKGITLFPQPSPPSLREAHLRVSWMLLPLSTPSLHVPRKMEWFSWLPNLEKMSFVLFKASCPQHRELLWSFSQVPMKTSLPPPSVFYA